MMYVNELGWHIGEKLPYVESIETLTADGHELDYILHVVFHDKLDVNHRVIIWKGFLATEIYLQLCSQPLLPVW